MYQLPTKLNELDDNIYYNNKNNLIIKSYGLPYIFWGYFLAGSMLLLFMFIPIYGPLLKLYKTMDSLNILLVIAVCLLFISIPFISLCFLFYTKYIMKKNESLVLKDQFFNITIRKRIIKDITSFNIQHFSNTPNIAKKTANHQLKDYQNHGYFLLQAITAKNTIIIDRSNRKDDLEKLQKLLQ